MRICDYNIENFQIFLKYQSFDEIFLGAILT